MKLLNIDTDKFKIEYQKGNKLGRTHFSKSTYRKITTADPAVDARVKSNDYLLKHQHFFN